MKAAAKRCLDVVGSAVLLIVSIPLFLFVAAYVAITIGPPVLFAQMRPGLNGKPFMLLKFRTMTDNRDATGQALPDEDRLGRAGKVLRATSLDELPELWNVLRGDMSLVGPRPLLMEYLTLYSPEQAKRHTVRPGITGWAQVNGRNSLPWKQRFELDVWYVEHQNLYLDIKILLMSVAGILSGRGISQPGHATMPPFRGNENSAEPSKQSR